MLLLLSTDILLCIFVFSDLNDRTTCAAVCKIFRNVICSANNNNILWQSVIKEPMRYTPSLRWTREEEHVWKRVLINTMTTSSSKDMLKLLLRRIEIATAYDKEQPILSRQDIFAEIFSHFPIGNKFASDIDSKIYSFGNKKRVIDKLHSLALRLAWLTSTGKDEPDSTWVSSD